MASKRDSLRDRRSKRSYSFPKDSAQKQIIEAAYADPRLIPLAVAGASFAIPIYMRDSTS